jgi:TonB family protein
VQKPGPAAPYKFLPNESYRQSPVIKFQINEDGSVSNARLVRSSGVKDIDKKVLKAVSSWKYEAVPGCILDSEMTVIIDWE